MAATLNETVPLPEPLPPAVIDSQDAADVAVHEQPAGVLTLTVPLVAAAGTDVLTGETENVQVGPACVTGNVCPPIAIVPLRDDVPEFVVTLYVTCPLPLPLAPAVTVIHDVLLNAVHAHPLPAVTATVAEPAVAPRVALTGERTYVQAAASCVTVNVRPAIVTVPVRAVVLVLAAIE